MVEDIAICEYGDRNGFFDSADLIPVCQTLRTLEVVSIDVEEKAHTIDPSLFSRASMTSENLGAGPFEQSCIRDSLLYIGKDAKFSRDRDRKIGV